jgi:hypothetical protein
MKLELVKITNNRGNAVYYITEDGKMNNSRVYNHLDEAKTAFKQIQNEWSSGKMEVLMVAEL